MEANNYKFSTKNMQNTANQSEKDFEKNVSDLNDNDFGAKKSNEKSLFLGMDKKRLETLACFIFTPLFILAVFAVMLYVFDIYPLGKYTMSSYDMLAQVAPYIEHFFDVIEGKSSLFYSYAIAGGADVFGTLAYCCVSPFTFIFLLFGRGNVYYGTAIVLPLKVVCVSISALIYLKKRFKNINPFLLCALALSYAFCGYLFVSNTYINWVDLLIWLPIVAYGFKNIVEGKKKTVFVVGMALMIYTCFSISCFALLTIFPIMIAYCLTVVEKTNRKKIITDIVIALCLTVAVSLPILVPSLWAFLVSGRKTGLFDNLFNEIKAEPIYYKASYLFTDGLTLVFTLVYFFKYGVKRPIDRFLAISACFIFAPVFFDPIMNLLNFGSYMSYALRFGFLNGFYFLFVASSYFDEYCLQRNLLEKNEEIKTDNQNIESSFETFEKTKQKNIKNNFVFSLIGAVLIAGAIVGLVILQKNLRNGKFVQSFSGRFAHSLGGLEATAIMCGIVAIIALYAHLLMHYNKLSKWIAFPIMLVTVCMQSVFYSSHLVVGNSYNPVRWSQIGAFTEYVKELDGHGDSRVKMCGDYLTADMPFTLNTNAFTVFSSVTDARNFVPTSFFEFGGNGSNTMKSYNGTVLGDSVLGYKYFISDRAVRTYLDEVEGYDQIKDENGNVIDVGEYTLYQNPYVFPSAFTVYSVPQKNPDNRFEEYKALMQSYTGKSDALTVLEVSESNIIEQDVEGVFRVKNLLRGSGNYYFYFDFEDYKDIYYVKGGTYQPESLKVLPDNNVLTLGYGSGGSYSVCLIRKNGEPLTNEYVKEHVRTFCVMDSTVEEISKRATEQNVKVELSAGKIKATVTQANYGEYLYLNYVYLPNGHTVTVNGKVAEFEDNLLNFMYVQLEAGDNVVEIEYQSPYVKAFLLSLIVALMLVGLYCILFVKKKVSLKKLQPVIAFAAYALAGFITVFFFIMPTCVFAYKGFLKLINVVKGFF